MYFIVYLIKKNPKEKDMMNIYERVCVHNLFYNWTYHSKQPSHTIFKKLVIVILFVLYKKMQFHIFFLIYHGLEDRTYC